MTGTLVAQSVADLRVAIPRLRESVVAIFRLRQTQPEKITKKGKVIPATFNCGFGSGFCVSSDKYVVTAFHVLNDGKPRNPADRFYVLTVPQNGNPFYHFPVVAFPMERQDVDVAVLEIGPCTTTGIHLPASPVSFATQQDGTPVITTGFPSPQIGELNADPHTGEFRGASFFLKSHANFGIVAAQYVLDSGVYMYELNIGWHHGESGGPIATLADDPAVFSLMQHYRNIPGPNGVLDGPRRGVALSVVQPELQSLGVIGV